MSVCIVRRANPPGECQVVYGPDMAVTGADPAVSGLKKWTRMARRRVSKGRMTRYFTVEQAARLLPEIQRLLVRARKAQWKLGTDHGATDELEESLTAIQELGAQVRDLDGGLVDFPSRFLGREVRLCYRIGDSGISHWQSVEDGDRSRRRIDRRFLEHHSGGAIQ